MKTIKLMRDSFEKTYCREVNSNMGSSTITWVIDAVPKSGDLKVGDQIEVLDTLRCYNNHFETITDVVTIYRVFPYDDLFLCILKVRGELIGKKEEYAI